MGRHPPEYSAPERCSGRGYQLMLLNTEGQLSNGEWCVKAECGQSYHRLVRDEGSQGPWSYDSNKRQMLHNEYNKYPWLSMSTPGAGAALV